jgi:hypothetical protein
MRDHVWGSADTKVGVARIVAVIVLACGAVCCCQQAVFASPPNILLIVSEDHGPELGCYGDPYAKTPRLDALAAEGVRFDRAFVAQAGCSPSRASFLTGLYPHEHGQVGLATWGFRLYRPDTPNVVRSLSDAGYRTGSSRLIRKPASSTTLRLIWAKPPMSPPSIRTSLRSLLPIWHGGETRWAPSRCGQTLTTILL